MWNRLHLLSKSYDRLAGGTAKTECKQRELKLFI